MRLQELLIQLPAIELYVENIIEDLLDKKTVIVAIPPQYDVSDMEYLLRGKIRERRLHAEEVLLPELPDGELPAAQIGARFSVDWVSANCPRTVENLLVSSGLPECILLSGFFQLPEKKKGLWLDFLNTWSRAPLSGSSRGIQQKPALCLVADMASIPMNSTPQLSIRRWFGFPSALEVMLLCRYGEGPGGGQRERARWREYLLPSLVESDVALAEKMWDIVFKPVDEIIAFLAEDAREKGWSKNALLDWGIDPFITANRRDMDISRIQSVYPKLLANGVLCRTLEYGTGVHISALAALQLDDRIKKRIWRGQLSLLLSMVDNIRLFLCDILTEKHGAGWPLFFPPSDPEELEQVKFNPRACQLGHIHYSIHNYPHFLEEKKYLTLIQTTRKIRNELAHYRTVNYSEYKGMVLEAKKYGLLFI